jgi:hypothetical protein
MADTRSWTHTGSSRWLAVALLALVALALVGQVVFPPAPASAQVKQGEGPKLFAVSGQITSGSYGLYLVDPANGAIVMYEWLPNTRQLRLSAARNFKFDLQLEDYNTTPSPREVQDLVRQANKLNEAKTQD